MRGSELPALTPFTITDPAKLKREFEKVPSQGYAIEYEESALQATCIGVPILNERRAEPSRHSVFPVQRTGFDPRRTTVSPPPY